MTVEPGHLTDDQAFLSRLRRAEAPQGARMTTETSRSLPLLDTTSKPTADLGGGCGCGGCGCGAEAGTSDAPTITDQDAGAFTDGVTRSYAVTGMTCGHCTSSVTSELTRLDGVTGLRVDLVPEGTSTVTVTSRHALDDTQVAAALQEAGDYQLA